MHSGLSRVSLLFKCEGRIKTLSEALSFRIVTVFATVTSTLPTKLSNSR